MLEGVREMGVRIGSVIERALSSRDRAGGGADHVIGYTINVERKQ